MQVSKKNIILNAENPSRNYFAIVLLLIVFILLLIGISIAVLLNFFDVSAKFALVAILVLLPFAGLIVATGYIFRHSQRIFALSKYEGFLLKLMPPEDQRIKLNKEIVEIASILDIPEEQYGDLRAAYILAEDLALRQIEQEIKHPLKRHIKIGEAEFDAIFINRDILTFVEVIFLVSPEISKEKIKKIFSKIRTAKKNFQNSRIDSRFRLMIALVTQLEEAQTAELKGSLVQKFSETTDDVDIRFFDFEELQRIFTE